MARQTARVAVLCGYMPYFDEIMPAGYRETKHRWGERVAGLFEDGAEVLYTGLITDHEAGFRAARQLQAFGPDVILLAPAMAAPAGYTWTAIRDFAGVPVVIWNAHELESVPPSYDMPDLCRHSANVGTLMISNVLLRHGRKPVVITGLFRDEAVRSQVRAAVQVGALVGRLRRSRFGVLGGPMDGYLNVTVDPGDLKAKTGITLVDLSAAELTDAYRAASDSAVADLAGLLRSRHQVEVADEREYLASVRLAAALWELIQRHDLVGGTFNCRYEYSVLNPEIGLIGCLANTHLTTSGYPFTCTGDVITAIAMYLGKALGGSALYCECDAIDYAKDLMLCANTGEGDFCQAAESASCRIFATGAASGRHSAGCSVAYKARAGPGTLVGFSPRADARGGYAIIAAPGEILGSPDLAIQVPTLWFRFRNGPAAEAFNRWCMAGATHHGAVCAGDLAPDLAMVGDLLGIETSII